MYYPWEAIISKLDVQNKFSSQVTHLVEELIHSEQAWTESIVPWVKAYSNWQ